MSARSLKTLNYSLNKLAVLHVLLYLLVKKRSVG